MLVLSKCDKIKADSADGDRVINLINLNSRQLVKFPYRFELEKEEII